MQWIRHICFLITALEEKMADPSSLDFVLGSTRQSIESATALSNKKGLPTHVNAVIIIYSDFVLSCCHIYEFINTMWPLETLCDVILVLYLWSILTQ